MDRAFLVAQLVKNLPAMQEIWVQSLGWEDPLEKEITTDSGILVWRIPWTEKSGGLQSMGSHRVRHDWAANITQVTDIPKLYFLQCFHKSKIISKENDYQHYKEKEVLLNLPSEFMYWSLFIITVEIILIQDIIIFNLGYCNNLLIGLLAFAHVPTQFIYIQPGQILKIHKSGHVTLHKVIHWLCIAWKIKFKPTSVAYKILYAWAALCLLLPSSWTIMLQLPWLFSLFLDAWTH